MVGSDDFDMVDGKMKQSTILKICYFILVSTILVCFMLFSKTSLNCCFNKSFWGPLEALALICFSGAARLCPTQSDCA